MKSYCGVKEATASCPEISLDIIFNQAKGDQKLLFNLEYYFVEIASGKSISLDLLLNFCFHRVVLDMTESVLEEPVVCLDMIFHHVCWSNALTWFS